jgi:hypothetical protein
MAAQIRAFADAREAATVDAILAGTTSATLNAAAARLRSLAPTSLAEATRLVTEEAALLPAALPAPTARAVRGLTLELGRAASATPAERARLAEAAAPRLARAVTGAAAEFGRVERVVVTEGLAAGLRDLGYSLTRASGAATSAIEASRGHEKVLVVVEDGGMVTTDWAGLRDGRCLDRQAELEAAAGRYGIDLGETKPSLHHDPRGGQTIAAAGRRHAANLAEGAVKVAEQAHAAEESARPVLDLYERHPGAAGRRQAARS